MTKRKTTRSALLMSTLSMVLCMAMLVGSTFAWFTDSVTSGGNRIVAGNLDVELYFKNASTDDWADASEANSEKPNFFVDKNGEDILWEPGVMAVTQFKIVNEGNLALKYSLKSVTDKFNSLDGKDLRDVIRFAVIDGDVTITGRDSKALSGVEYEGFESFSKSGTLNPGTEDSESSDIFTVVAYWEPNLANDDLYNVKNGAYVNDYVEGSDNNYLWLDIEISLSATQQAYENDSFGNDYDGSAAWLGNVDTTWFDENTDTFTIDSPDKFAGLAKLVNDKTDFTDKTIVLNSNMDLGGIEWTPIGSKEEKIYFTGTFDGNGKTISGLNIASGDYVSLFGAIKNATIKNLTVKGSVDGENGAGIVARMESGTVENCKSYVNVESAGKAGGIVCLTNNSGCIISGCENYGTVKGADEGTIGGVGGIVAYANPNTVISDCKNFGDIGSEVDTRSGGIVGYGCTAGSSIRNCENSGKIVASQNAGGIVGITTGAWNIITCTNSGIVESSGYAGGIAGSVQNGKVEGCKNTAPVSGKTAGGVVGVTGGAPEIILCSGGTARITTPAQKLGFNGHPLVLDLAENACAGRLIGANGGGGPEAWTKLTIDDTNGDDTSICAVGLCGPYTTWANLEIVSGTFYGDPVAGNMTYIKLDEGAVWADREAGTYSCGGVTESTRKTEWTKN